MYVTDLLASIECLLAPFGDYQNKEKSKKGCLS